MEGIIVFFWLTQLYQKVKGKNSFLHPLCNLSNSAAHSVCSSSIDVASTRLVLSPRWPHTQRLLRTKQLAVNNTETGEDDSSMEGEAGSRQLTGRISHYLVFFETTIFVFCICILHLYLEFVGR